MRHVGVESEDEIATGLCEAGFHRTGIAAAPFRDDARAEPGGGLASAVGGGTVDHDDLEVESFAIEPRAQARDQDDQIIALVDDRKNYRKGPIVVSNFYFGSNGTKETLRGRLRR